LKLYTGEPGLESLYEIFFAAAGGVAIGQEKTSTASVGWHYFNNAGYAVSRLILENSLWQVLGDKKPSSLSEYKWKDVPDFVTELSCQGNVIPVECGLLQPEDADRIDPGGGPGCGSQDFARHDGGMGHAPGRFKQGEFQDVYVRSRVSIASVAQAVRPGNVFGIKAEYLNTDDSVTDISERVSAEVGDGIEIFTPDCSAYSSSSLGVPASGIGTTLEEICGLQQAGWKHFVKALNRSSTGTVTVEVKSRDLVATHEVSITP
jgi:hypothetical protein